MSGGRRYRALLVANTRLQGDPEHLGPLTAPPDDAAGLRDALTDGGRGLHRAEDVSVHIDKTRDEVLQAIGRFFGSASPDDQLLLYYSGHGIADDHHRLYLCASDTMAQFPFSTAIPTDVVARMMDVSAAAAVVVVLDCCYSADFQKAADADQQPAARLAGPRCYVLANGTDGAGADGPAARRTGALTEAVVAGLLAGREADSGQPGLLSLEELWSFVVDRLDATGDPAPRRWFAGAGDLLVARVPAPLPVAPTADAGDVATGPGPDPSEPPAGWDARPESGDGEPGAALGPEQEEPAGPLGDQPDGEEPAHQTALGDQPDGEEPAHQTALGDQPDGEAPAHQTALGDQLDGEGLAGLADVPELADVDVGQELRSAAARRPQRRSWMDTMLTAAQRREVMGWELEFEYVRQESPHAAALLQLCAFLDSRGIPVGLLVGAGDVLPPELADITHERRALNAAVAVLEEHGLIVRSGDLLTVPRLVQFAVRSNLGSEHGREWSGRALCLVAQAFSPPGRNAPQPAWAHPTRLLVHAEAAAGHAQALGVPIEQLPAALGAIGTHLWSVGKPTSARVWFERALEATRQLYGTVDRNVATAMEKLAAVYQEVGEVERADRLHHDALVMSSALDRGLVRPLEDEGPEHGQP